MSALETRELFGGAMEIKMPARFIDVSDIREIPDNQEVWTDVNTDQSVIIELLSQDESVTNEQLAQFHWDSLVHDNDATQHQILQVGQLTQNNLPTFGDNVYKVMLIGQQHIAKFHESAANTVNVYMCVIRLPSVQTDVVLTFNDPQVINPQSSSKPITLTQPSENLQLFLDMLKTFVIKDYSLFG